jgi:hypothetical protein
VATGGGPGLGHATTEETVLALGELWRSQSICDTARDDSMLLAAMLASCGSYAFTDLRGEEKAHININ